MRLSIVIISFNTKQLTDVCVQSLKDAKDYKVGRDFEVVVIDNGSHDGSIEMLQEKHPEVKLVETGENLGFSKGNNRGVVASNSETEFVLFLNSDTVVPSGTLSSMVKFMDKNEDIGVSTCRVDLWSGGIDMDCHRGFPTPWVSFTRLIGLQKIFPKSRLFNRYYMGWEDLEQTHEVESVVGAFMLVPKKYGDQIGWWDEDFFLNGEDIDFCYRIKEKGLKVMYHPEVSIIHYRGASKGTRKESKTVAKNSNEGKKLVASSSVNAMKLFYDKHYRDKYSVVTNAVIDFGLVLLKGKRLFSVR